MAARVSWELADTMLSPEAERVLRYLVEVEELAEEVLADKRQVGGPFVALGPGFGGWGLLASAVGRLRVSESQWAGGLTAVTTDVGRW